MTISTATAIDEFRAAMAAAGLTPPAEIFADGKRHRFATNGKRRDKAGWYVLYADAMPAGAFGCWRAGVKETWHANGATMTEVEKQRLRTRMEAIRKEREAEERKRHAQAATRAEQLWATAELATAEHPYLRKKGVQSHGLRLHHDGRVIVPIFDAEQKLWSLEFIDGEGDKEFLYGGKKKGGFFMLGTVSGVVLLAEGYATAASIYEATGTATVCAFDAGNLLPVAQALRQKFPGVNIVLCGDNDASDTGQRAAKEAAEAVGGLVVIPETEGMDWNDVHVKYGLDVVKRAINATHTGGAFPTGPGGPGGPSPHLERGKPLDRSENATGPQRSTGPVPTQFPTVSGYRIAPEGVFEVPADPDKPEIRLTLKPCGVLAHCRDGG